MKKIIQKIMGLLKKVFFWLVNKIFCQTRTKLTKKVFMQKSGQNCQNIQGENINIISNKYDNETKFG